MVSLVKLVRNGNSTQVTIPRNVLTALGWLPGDHVILGITEDKRLLARRLSLTELGITAAEPAATVAPAELTR